MKGHRLSGRLAALLGFALLSNAISALGQIWTQTGAPPADWGTVVCSADGARLAAVIYDKAPSPIYLSTNAGATWTTNGTPNQVWGSIACSADGNTLLASVASYSGTNVLFFSTNAAANWGLVPTAPNLGSLASSADGRRWVAAAGYGGIYSSTNTGITWMSNNVPSGFWKAVTSSADGTKLLAIMSPNVASYAYRIYASRDAGATWALTSAPGLLWTQLASSADGMRLVAVATYSAYTSGAVYTSTNSGSNWFQSEAPDHGWSSVAISADGNTCIAAAPYDKTALNHVPVYCSTNAGNSWHPTSSPNAVWSTVVVSADGGKCFLISRLLRGIWTSQPPRSLQLNLKPVGANLELSWVAPSTDCLLQQNDDFSSTNWIAATNVPVLNYSNLQYHVMVSPTSNAGCFRLKSQ